MTSTPPSQCVFRANATDPTIKTCLNCNRQIISHQPTHRVHANCEATDTRTQEQRPTDADQTYVRNQRLAACAACQHGYSHGTRCTLTDLGCANTLARLRAHPTATCPIGKWTRYPNARILPPHTTYTRTAQLIRATYHLANQLPTNITAVAGIPRSGMIPATIIATYRHLPLFTLDTGRLIPTGHGTRSASLDTDLRRVLIVDDTIHNGGTVTTAREQAKHANPNTRFIYAAAFARPDSTHHIDLWGETLPSPHILEWNILNTFWTQSIAADMDGLICADCRIGHDDDGPNYARFLANAQPIHLPLFVPLKAIITARLEKYRRPTERWLAAYKVKYAKLICCPAENNRQRQQMNIPQWKANQADELAADLYLESDQALAEAMQPFAKITTPLWVPSP